MDSACFYEQQTVINELTQGIKMAKELRTNLNSAEARHLFIQKILSSYDNALSLLKSGDTLSLPNSSNESTQSRDFEFNQSFFDHQEQNHVVHRKRKGLTEWEDQVRMCTDNVLEMTYDWKRACNQGAGFTASPPPQPPSPEKYEIKPTQNHQQFNELSNLKATLSVNTWDFNTDVIPFTFSIPSTPFGFMEDTQLHFPNYVEEDELLLQVYSPRFISPDTSESNYFSEWGSSQSLDHFLADPTTDVEYPEFQFSNSFFLDENEDPKFCRQVSWIGTIPF